MSKAVLVLQTSAEFDICLPEAHFHLARALYHHRAGELSPDLRRSLIGRLQMVLRTTLETEGHQAIRQKISDFLATLASTM